MGASTLKEQSPFQHEGLAEAPVAATPHYHGHRDRLRERFDEAGPSGFASYELLELMLFRSIPRVDTKPVAKALLERFGSISGVLGASARELQKIDRIGPSAAREIRIVAAILERAMKDDLKGRQVLSSWSSVIEYCHVALQHEDQEKFHVLFLDKKNALIRDEEQQRGTVDHTPVYPRELVRRALELGATAMIIVHNHPSGDPTPSRADIDMTKTIIDTAVPMGITVHDHIIVGRGSHVSFRALKLI